MTVSLSLTVNGVVRQARVEASATLLELLRDEFRLTGTKEGCSNGNCGSCTVLLDGLAVCSCLVLAAEAEDRSIVTVEGVSSGATLHPIQQSLVEHGGTQCGFCTPGVLLSAMALLDGNPAPDEAEVRHAIAGNLCRCTGYGKIVDAVLAAAASMREMRA